MNSYSYAGIEVSVNASGNNRPMRLHLHEGRHYIESRQGTEYSIEITNRNWYRVEVVASVDGLGVINGKPASKSDTGYVIPAYGTFRIKGYRKDNIEVGAFKFTSQGGSYATSKGSEDNVGVIAIAVYKEKQPQYLYGGITYTYHTSPTIGGGTFWDSTGTGGNLLRGITTGGYAGGDNLVIGSATATCMGTPTASNCTLNSSLQTTQNFCSQVVDEPVARQEHGTTWGSVVRDEVTTTSFERDYLILEKEIYYDSRESLINRGVKLKEEKLMVKPRGFPSDYATPPAHWRG